jgi:DNA-binding NarL/FixJ family response regulator
MITEASRAPRGLASPRVIRVGVCDASEIARLGITIGLEPYGVEVVTSSGAADLLLPSLAAEPADVVLVDVGLPAMEAVIRQLVDRGVTVIGIGVEADDERPLAALIAGAVGYLTKDLPPRDWAEGIKAALRGEAPLSRLMTARLVQAYRERSASSVLTRLLPSDTRLTAREWEILTRVSEGKTNRAVAEELFISVETVRTHVSSILAKLEAPNRSAAAAMYHQLVRAV